MSNWKPYRVKRSRVKLTGCVSVGGKSMTIAEDVAEYYIHSKDYDYILLLFNEEEGLAAIKPNKESDGLKVRSTGKSRAITLQAKSFINHYGILPRKYALTWKDGMLIFEPDQAEAKE